MPKEDPTSPIVPSGRRLRSNDVELAHFAKPPPRCNQRRSSSKFFVYTLAPIVILRAAFLGFALIVRVKNPELRLRRVNVKSLNYSTVASFSAPSTVSPVGEAILRNTNFGGFEFLNDTAVSVIHGRAALGRGKIEGGRAGARERPRVTVKMEVRSSELSADVDGSKNLASDIGSNIARAQAPERASKRRREREET